MATILAATDASVDKFNRDGTYAFCVRAYGTQHGYFGLVPPVEGHVPIDYAEGLAALWCLRWIDKNMELAPTDHVALFTDSKALIDVYSGFSDGGKASHILAPIIREIKKLTDNFGLSMIKIKAHQPDDSTTSWAMNDWCDRTAISARYAAYGRSALPENMDCYRTAKYLDEGGGRTCQHYYSLMAVATL